ncbi:hypothetical protein [Fusobacterium polymorphum]|uniref:Uncharacterized protein n=1 Tax=Fusobacterium nucleatum subsp. polymorphum TaxID=76857 RepID=A0A2C6BR39_FUSNP|nr:hypothetical protein [Fusobacterium polymorphum]PHI06584.1 hypothetical protein CBG54_05835 [Fusobacterium polymorphum]
MAKSGLIMKAMLSKTVDDADKMASKVILGVTDTIKQSGTEIKVALFGAGLSMASSLFDLDAPLSAIGLSQEGFDQFAGEVGNLLIEGAGLSAGYKLISNVSDRLSQDLSTNEIIKELGLTDYMELEDEDKNKKEETVEELLGN